MAPLRKTRRESKQDQSTGGTGYGSSAGAGAIRGKGAELLVWDLLVPVQ